MAHPWTCGVSDFQARPDSTEPEPSSHASPFSMVPISRAAFASMVRRLVTVSCSNSVTFQDKAKASFEKISFLRGASFHETEFLGDTSFRQAHFSDFASFMDTKFFGNADFDGATFLSALFWKTGHSNVNFHNASFTDFAAFEVAEFRGPRIPERDLHKKHIVSRCQIWQR